MLVAVIVPSLFCDGFVAFGSAVLSLYLSVLENLTVTGDC